MNKITCNVIKDLLPLYIDDFLSDDSKKLIEGHISNCSDCKKELELLKSFDKRAFDKDRFDKDSLEANDSSNEEAYEIIKGVKNKINSKINRIKISSLIIIILSILTYSYLTKVNPIDIERNKDIINLKENRGLITLNIKSNYKLTKRIIEEDDGVYSVYHIKLFKTPIDSILGINDEKTIVVNPDNSIVNAIYLENSSLKNDKLIYSNKYPKDLVVVTFPKNIINMYLIMIVIIFAIICIMKLFIRKNKKINKLLTNINIAFLSFLISYICISGFKDIIVPSVRNFTFAIILMIPINILIYTLKSKDNNI